MIASQISLPADLLSDFRLKLAPFFAARAGGKKLVRRPRLGLTLAVPGEPEAILEIRPAWCGWDKRLDTETLAVDLLVNRAVQVDLLRHTSHRPLELGLTLTPDGERISHLSSRFGVEARDRLVDAVASFLADPMASLSRSNERCCFCCRKLTDGTSRLRGYGPTCSKKIGTLLGLCSGEPDGFREMLTSPRVFDLITSPLDRPDHDDPEGDAFGIEAGGRDGADFVPGTEGDNSRDALNPGPEVEQPDPLDRHFNTEAVIWQVVPHHGRA